MTPAEYAKEIYAGWHREDTVCYTDSRGRFQHYSNRQLLLYLPGRPEIVSPGSGASEERWISYWPESDEPDIRSAAADRCRRDAEELRSNVASAGTIEDAAEIVNRFYQES